MSDFLKLTRDNGHEVYVRASLVDMVEALAPHVALGTDCAHSRLTFSSGGFIDVRETAESIVLARPAPMNTGEQPIVADGDLERIRAGVRDLRHMSPSTYHGGMVDDRSGNYFFAEDVREAVGLPRDQLWDECK